MSMLLCIPRIRTSAQVPDIQCSPWVNVPLAASTWWLSFDLFNCTKIQARFHHKLGITVDGRNPAPPDIYEILSIMGYLPYQLISRISSINIIMAFSGAWVLLQKEPRHSNCNVFLDSAPWLKLLLKLLYGSEIREKSVDIW